MMNVTRRSRPFSTLLCRNDGVALVEFALLAPIFALLLVGIVDFGLAFLSKLRLSTAVAEGAHYAFLSGASVQASQVQTIVQNATSLTPISVSATYDANSCYCLTGSPATKVVQTCGTACANGAPAGKYLDILATHVYQPIFASYGLIANPNLTASATVRVQ